MKVRDKRIHPTRKNKDKLPSQIVSHDLPPREHIPTGKTLFKPEYVHIARVLMEAGSKLTALSRAFMVDPKTIKSWLHTYPEFNEAVVEGQDYCNTGLIEKALVSRATGYDYNEDTYEAKPNPKSKTDDDRYKMILSKRVKKHVAPSERAIEYFLNNRARFSPDQDGNPRWAHTNKLEVTGAGGKDLIPDSISPEKLLAELIMQQKKADEIVEAELIEAKQIGVAVSEDTHDETPPT